MDPTISPKAYWSILKTFLNNKKIPCIPPIHHNNNYITDFKEKAQILKHLELIYLNHALRMRNFSSNGKN